MFIYSHTLLKFGSEITFSGFYSRNPFWTSQVWFGFSFHVLLFHSLRLYPCDDLLMCVCVCDLFFLWEGSYKHQVWEPFSKMAAIESSLPSSACHSPMEQWSLFFPSPWIQIGFNDSLGPIKCSRSSSWNSKAFTWVSWNTSCGEISLQLICMTAVRWPRCEKFTLH